MFTKKEKVDMYVSLLMKKFINKKTRKLQKTEEIELAKIKTKDFEMFYGTDEVLNKILFLKEEDNEGFIFYTANYGQKNIIGGIATDKFSEDSSLANFVKDPKKLHETFLATTKYLYKVSEDHSVEFNKLTCIDMLQAEFFFTRNTRKDVAPKLLFYPGISDFYKYKNEYKKDINFNKIFSCYENPMLFFGLGFEKLELIKREAEGEGFDFMEKRKTELKLMTLHAVKEIMRQDINYLYKKRINFESFISKVKEDMIDWLKDPETSIE